MDPLNTEPSVIKAEILRLTRLYSEMVHRANRPASSLDTGFDSRITPVPYAGRVFGAEEVEAAVSSTLDFWLTLGPEGTAFQDELADFLGVKHSLLVNSGSSANLVAFAALTTHKLPSHKRIRQGDEVITVAAGFPTTVAPIIQCGAVPVFIDNDPSTGNAKVAQLESAFVEGKTKAVMIAHTLGNPFDLGEVLDFCRRHDLWLIEDNCDALGSTYTMPLEKARRLGFTESSPGLVPPAGFITRYTGTWGDLSTQSFYPPHHITMGEGGAVNVVRQPALKSYAESFRDWGRDCWCASGKDDTCGRRFGWHQGKLPAGYDHKYIYSHLGYNLKPLDPQAAIGRVQLKRLPTFVEARKRNWLLLRKRLDQFGELFDFALPTHSIGWSQDSGFRWDSSGCRSECSWFGFMLRVKPSAPFSAVELASYLEANRIGNRMLFGGNLTKQPAFIHLARNRPDAFRSIDQLSGADSLMQTALFLGTYPGLSAAMIEYIGEKITKFAQNDYAKRMS